MFNPSAITSRPESRARRRHYYSDTETEATLSLLRAVLPDASASRLLKLGLAALVDRLQPQDADALERDLCNREGA